MSARTQNERPSAEAYGTLVIDSRGPVRTADPVQSSDVERRTQAARIKAAHDARLDVLIAEVEARLASFAVVMRP